MQHTPEKKIIVFDKFLGYNVGGAQRSLHKLLENLEVNFLYLGCDIKKSFNAKNFLDEKMNVKRFAVREFPKLPYFEYWLQRKKIKEHVLKQEAHILFTQGLSGAVAARYFPGKVVYFIRDEYQLNKIPVYQTGIKKILKFLYLLIQLPFILQMHNDNKKAIEKSSVVVANSTFMQHEVKHTFKRDSVVVYPMRDVESLIRQGENFKPGEYIVSIGSELIKGRYIVESIAERMKERKFMIIGRDFLKAKTVGNIVYQPWYRNSLDVYKQANLVLIPSVWEESSPGVSIEAQSLSLPILVSNKGGMGELVDKRFIISELYDIDEWVHKIKLIEGDSREFILQDKRKLLKFDFREQTKIFKHVMSKEFSLDL